MSSLTSSPDSSPSPIAIALGQVNPQTTISLSSGVGGNGSSGGGGGGGGGGSNSSGAGTGGSNSTSAAIQNQLSESKLWMSANSTTASPHSLSPKAFSFDSGTNPTSTADSGNPADTLRLVFTITLLLHSPRQLRRSHCPAVCTGLGLHLIVYFSRCFSILFSNFAHTKHSHPHLPYSNHPPPPPEPWKIEIVFRILFSLLFYFPNHFSTQFDQKKIKIVYLNPCMSSWFDHI